ncbi:anti-sigma factor [Roseomonas sp. 18066]|uniref:anti-sigma factor family protein n=1 Tax=Roseomonas sp. 18066 TaxID=2681412 RepID=UPI00190F2C93|nr:anti-sigma factor [Roseomonas sp. 18066]
MTTDPCQEMHLLIQADIDGELQAAEAARVAAHLDGCPACAGLQRRLIALSGSLRDGIPRHRAPAHLREAVRRRIARPDAPPPPPQRRGAWPFGTAAMGALAAALALFVLLPGPDGRDSMPDWVVAAHIRALQPQHLLDVVSAEQHTVKPWFAGRLPFAPPVKDLAAAGFPLIGARLDQLPGSAAAALVYKRREHVINLFIRPAPPEEDPAETAGSREGYNFLHWSAGGMSFWVASDLNTRELDEFAGLWR